jgi:hypothetical protein
MTSLFKAFHLLPRCNMAQSLNINIEQNNIVATLYTELPIPIIYKYAM